MKFSNLIDQIQSVHELFYRQSVKAVNLNLSVRNWLVGRYIVEFQQNGEDRASYGTELLKKLAKEIAVKGMSHTNLKICRQFYLEYPQMQKLIFDKDIFPRHICQTLSNHFLLIDDGSAEIGQAPSDLLIGTQNQMIKKSQTVSDQFNYVHLKDLVTQCSFSHFIELIKIETLTKRRFYELLILKTTLSVRELKRQIESLAFERVGLGEEVESSFKELESKILPESTSDIVKSHYFFDFLNLKSPQLIEESELEEALINHLQQFIIELGNGFCFEARQKMVLIGDEYFHIDLVFYHRILKCHVLVELKTEFAKHEHVGQLKVYIEHFKRKVRLENDNPPVGILLVTGQNKTLVEYAVADSDKEIFVSQYRLELPKEEELQLFIENEIKTINYE